MPAKEHTCWIEQGQTGRVSSSHVLYLASCRPRSKVDFPHQRCGLEGDLPTSNDSVKEDLLIGVPSHLGSS